MSETQERVQKEHGVGDPQRIPDTTQKKKNHIHLSSWRLKAIYKSLWQTAEVPDTFALQNIWEIAY